MYKGSGKGERIETFKGTWEYRGTSKESLDDAIRAAVDASNVRSGTTLVISHVAVTTVDDPNVSDYIVVLTHGGDSGG